MTRRLHIGRWQVYIEPRDWWIGVYIAPTAIYICPLPTTVFKFDRIRRCRAKIQTRGGCYRCSAPAPGTPQLCRFHSGP